MRKDDLMLHEAYNKVITSQTVNEDLGALLKTAGGDVLRGIGGAAKKLGYGAQKQYSKIKQAGIGAMAGATGKNVRSEPGQPATSYEQETANRVDIGKKQAAIPREQTAARISQYLNNILPAINRDLKLLKMNVADQDTLKKDLFNVFLKHLAAGGTIASATGQIKPGTSEKVALK
jgi:hypothetical protein